MGRIGVWDLAATDDTHVFTYPEISLMYLAETKCRGRYGRKLTYIDL